MSDRFSVCAGRVLDVEGGYVDHPDDRGGPTHRGVTMATFRTAQARGIVPEDRKLRDLTKAEAERIFHSLYWQPAKCGAFPAPVDYLLFDAFVNHRPGPAVELVQKALKVPADGVVGSKTIGAALINTRLSLVVARYITERDDFYEALIADDPTQLSFRNGWKNRLVEVHRWAMKDLEDAA